MKRNIINLIIYAGLLLTFAGCTKERSDVEIALSNNNNIETQVISGKFGPLENATGVLVGKIVTNTKYSLFLYNEKSKNNEYIIDLRTGYFVFKDIQPGVYTLWINPADATFEPLEMRNILIEVGQITNLGLIDLY